MVKRLKILTQYFYYVYLFIRKYLMYLSSYWSTDPQTYTNMSYKSNNVKNNYQYLGAFKVEMERERQNDRTILCRYDPTEPGDYVISVRWSGRHVIGSPFQVKIFESRSELTEHLKSLKGAAFIVPELNCSQWQEEV